MGARARLRSIQARFAARHRGLGDTFAAVASALGLPACRGCSRRQEILNRWFPYPSAPSPPSTLEASPPRVLFLDDRPERWTQFQRLAPHAVWTRTAAATIDRLAESWDFVFLDHDLNDVDPPPLSEQPNNSGTVVARWIAEHSPRIGRLIVHSTNHFAAPEMVRILAPRAATWVPFDDPRFDPERFRAILDQPPEDPTELARLAACDTCDQRVATLCTLTGTDCPTLCADAAARCPLGRFPGEELAHKLRHPTAPETPWPWLTRPAAIRLTFSHGLGDTVQFTAVLAHLAHHWPHVEIDALVRPGCESLFRPFCRRVDILGPREHHEAHEETRRETGERYALDVSVRWPEAVTAYADSPSTKVERFLRDVLKVAPLPPLNHYYATYTPDHAARALEYLATLDAVGRSALIQPAGRCGENLKNMPPEVYAAAVAALRRRGLVPLVVDFDGRAPQIDNPPPNLRDAPLWPLVAGQPLGEASQLAAVAALSRVNVGIDSGPSKIFQAPGMPPALIYWRKMHPLNYAAPEPHALHLVPTNHETYLRGDRATALQFFPRYHHATYNPGHAAADIANVLHSLRLCAFA